MRDPGVVDALDALERNARAFDEITAEQDAHYSARSFVRWVRLETTTTREMVATAGSNGDGRTSAQGASLSVIPERSRT